jgi:hypothetical protein
MLRKQRTAAWWPSCQFGHRAANGWFVRKAVTHEISTNDRVEPKTDNLKRQFQV